MAYEWLLPAAGAIGGIISGFQNSSIADDALQNSKEFTELQKAQINRINTISDDGSDDLASAMAGYINTVGDAGFFNPQEISNLSGYLGEDRDADRRQVERDLVTGSAMHENAGLERLGDDLTMGTAMANQFYTDSGITADASARVGGYDGSIDALASDYYNTYSDINEREANRFLGNIEADGIRKGRSSSTADIETRKAAADVMAEKGQQAFTKSIADAISTLGQRQSLDAGDQQQRLAEHGAEIAESGLDLNASGQNFNQYLAGLNSAQGLRTNADNSYWTNRSNTLGEIAGVKGLGKGDAMGDFNNAIAITSGLGALRGNSLSEITQLATAPYQFQMTGSSDIAKLGAYGAAASGNLYDSANTAATKGFNTAGQGLDRLFKNTDFTSTASNSNVATAAPAATGTGGNAWQATDWNF